MFWFYNWSAVAGKVSEMLRSHWLTNWVSDKSWLVIGCTRSNRAGIVGQFKYPTEREHLKSAHPTVKLSRCWFPYYICSKVWFSFRLVLKMLRTLCQSQLPWCLEAIHANILWIHLILKMISSLNGQDQVIIRILKTMSLLTLMTIETMTMFQEAEAPRQDAIDHLQEIMPQTPCLQMTVATTRCSHLNRSCNTNLTA